MEKKPSYEELENALRESEERYRSVVDNIGIGISAISPQMEILSLNKQMMDWFPQIDLSKKPICYKAFNNPPRQEICSYCPTIKTLNDGVPHESVTSTPSGDSFINYRIIATPVKDKEGKVVGAIEMVEDVTEKLEAEEALRVSLNNQESIFRAAPIGIGLVKDRIIIKANDRLCEIVGYERDELINKNARMLYPTEEEFNWVGEEKYRQISEHGTGTVETRWLRKDGTIINVLLSSTPLYPPDLSAGVTFTAFDISKRKEAERAIVEAKKQWEKTFDAMADIVTIQDKEMRIVRANKAAYTFFKAEYSQLNGMYCYELFTGKSEPCQDCPMVQTVKDTGNHSEIVEHETLGKIFLVSSSAITNSNGDLEYFVHTAKDITEQKALEERIRQSQKMEAVGTLTGGIAHDFNNILAAILGYAELIEKDVSPESQIGQDIKGIITSGRRAADLVKHLLAYSRKTGMIKQHIYPHLTIKEALKMLRATLPTSIVIEEEIDSHCGTVLMNPTNLHQIIINLCNNVAQAMPDRKGLIRINLDRQEINPEKIPVELDIPAGPFIVLSVSDTGCGIDGENKKRIFEPYFTTKEMGSGTGLGLAVVHGITHDCKGFIDVESAVGKGTTFRVFIPFSEKPVEESPQLDEEDILTAAGRSERIMVVDDDPLLTKICERRLTNNGYIVTCFTDSQEALEEFHGNPNNFDLLITDQTMPGLTGADLANAVLKIKPSMPIIMCTGHSETVSEEKAFSMGIKRYVYKPIKDDELLVAVREVLDENS